MSHTIDYSSITNEEEKKAKAMEDIKFYLGDRFEKMEGILKKAVASKEITDKKYMINCLEFFMGIQGYPARVWVDAIAPNLPEEPLVASTPDPETICVSANGPLKPVL